MYTAPPLGSEFVSKETLSTLLLCSLNTKKRLNQVVCLLLTLPMESVHSSAQVGSGFPSAQCLAPGGSLLLQQGSR